MTVNRRVSFVSTRGVQACVAALMSIAVVSGARAEESKPSEKAEPPPKKAEQEPKKVKQEPTKKAEPAPRNVKSVKKASPRADLGDTPTPITKPPVLHKDEEQLKKEQGPGPKAEFIKPDHDFGEQWVGGTMKHAFEVRNIGEKTLKILNVKPGCGCTLAGKYDKVIEPGAIGKIPVSVNSRKLYGKFRKTIRVSTDDPANQSATLSIAGEIKHYVEVAPRSANFRQLKPTEEKDVTLKLKNNGDQPLQLTLAKPKLSDSFTVEIVENVPGREFDLVVHARPPYKEGRISGTINLKTNNPKQADLKIRVAGTALARIEVKPKQIVITRPKKNEYTQKINITNYGDSPVHLLDASVDDEKLSLETQELEPGKKYQVAVKMPAGYKPDIAGKTVTLKFDDSEKPVVTIPIRSTTRTPRPAQLLEGKPAPTAEFTTKGGYTVNTADIKDQALAMIFYATWCPHCKKTLPEMEKIHQAYKDKGVRFIAMSLDNPNDRNQRKRFTPEQSIQHLVDAGVTFDAYVDTEKKIGPLFKATSFPTSFIVDKSGKITNVYIGGIYRKDRIESFKKDLDKLLQAQASREVSSAEGSQPATN